MTTIKRHIIDEIRQMKSRTDWDALRKQGDYEGEQEFPVDWTRATLVTPKPKKAISLRLDPDILAYFKAQGPGYQTRINAVLRAWVEAQTKR